MAKIWEKNNKEQSAAQRTFNSFTTGNDYLLDKEYFLKYDLHGSLAQALVLRMAGIYRMDEYKAIVALLNIAIENLDIIEVTKEDEDCHTAIEKYLTQHAGDLGKKIHTGRSRNDQSLTMIRLYMLDMLDRVNGSLTLLNKNLNNKSEQYRKQIFIGYSHTQQAMLTTLGHYYNAINEQLEDDALFIKFIQLHISKSPLGSGAGFGSPIYLDRGIASKQMGFTSVQHNSLYCQNSRGKFELMYIQGLGQIMLSLQRLASDILLYTSREFSFFDVSDELSQGSSMMPQKKNLDVFEIIRAKSAEVISLENRVQLIMKGLPSGYNRDLQIIKNAIVEATNTTLDCINITNGALDYIKPNDTNIRNSIKKDIYSADAAILKCMEDKSLNFRDVYKEILESDMNFNPDDIIKSRVSSGSPGNF